ncbi:MAG: hypothetical protein L0H26_06925, partial [Microlunatus sp.]|nr:hypothetical protein [Microlunatus sp.]
MSHVRATTGRDAISVEVTSWIRAVTRLDRAASAEPRFRWSDDGPADLADEGQAATYLPAVHCRSCGRSGWMVRLGPTGNHLSENDENIRREHQNARDRKGAARTRVLLHAPGEATAAATEEKTNPATSPLRWFNVANREILVRRPAEDDPDLLDGKVLPVLMHTEDEDRAARNERCPSCDNDDQIRFIGSAIATLMSVTTSTLFGDPALDRGEKRTLVFTDSVQDAAHRAGFVGSRSHLMSLRSAMRATVEPEPKNLPTWVDDTLRAAEASQFDRYRLVPNPLLGNELFKGYWETEKFGKVRSSSRTAVKNRLALDAALEVGLQSTFGRTLEATGSIAVQVALGSDIAMIQAAQMAITGDDIQALPVAGPEREKLVRWVRGIAEHLRREGGIDHKWFNKYKTENGTRFRVWGGRPDRNKGNPAFPPGRSTPRCAGVGGSSHVKLLLAPVTPSTSWYARWTVKCLGVSGNHAAGLAKGLLAEMAQKDWLSATALGGGASGTVYGIPPENVVVASVADADLAEHSLLVCDVCRTPLPTTPVVNHQLRGGSCLMYKCAGSLQPAERKHNFYRDLYGNSEMHRVNAHEHTSLLQDSERREVETGFKRPEQEPGDPNVLVATPTLEMGIDIGELSTVMLSGLPNTVAKYVQRVGRAGRRTGSSLNLAFVPGIGVQLSQLADPPAFINGAVRSPATYLDAEEILRRQFIAYVADGMARTAHRSGALPGELRTANDVLHSAEPDSFLGRLITHAREAGETLLEEFVGAFPEADAPGLEALREWALADDANGFAATVYAGHTGSTPTRSRIWNGNCGPSTPPSRTWNTRRDCPAPPRRTPRTRNRPPAPAAPRSGCSARSARTIGWQRWRTVVCSPTTPTSETRSTTR